MPKKPLPRKADIKLLPLFEIPAGSESRPLPSADPGKRKPIGWQQECFDKLARKRLRRIVAPTGSGKATVIRMLGIHDMTGRRRRVLVAVPQRDIAHGFDAKAILMGGRYRPWDPHPLMESDTPVEDVLTFLRQDEERGNAMVCTHQALVAAFKREPELFKDLSLVVDEGHHIWNEQLKGDREARNRLGDVAKHMIGDKTCRLTVVTATWFRSDGTIVPREVLEMAFETYVLPVDEYLKAMQYLRRITFRFVVGPQMAALASIIREDPKRRTFIYSEKFPDPKKKHAHLDRVKTALAPFKLNVVDLVTDDSGRDERRNTIFDAVKRVAGALDPLPGQMPAAQKLRRIKPELDALPHAIVSYNMMIEGADCPAASRAIMMAPRQSVLGTIQTLGRILRDFPGKEEAQFNIILPTENGVIEPERMADYLKVVCAAMVVEWQFRPIDIRGDARDTKHPHPRKPMSNVQREAMETASRLLNDPEFREDIADASWGIVVDSEGDEAEVDRAVERWLDKAAKDYPDLKDPLVREAVKIATRTLYNPETSEASRKVLDAFTKDAGTIPLEVALRETKTLSSKIRLLSWACGHKTLSDLRQRMGRAGFYSLEAHQAKIQELRAKGVKLDTQVDYYRAHDAGLLA